LLVSLGKDDLASLYRPLARSTMGPDNTNNVMALAFGVLIGALVVVGSLLIMADLNDSMMPAPELMNLRMQH